MRLSRKERKAAAKQRNAEKRLAIIRNEQAKEHNKFLMSLPNSTRESLTNKREHPLVHGLSAGISRRLSNTTNPNDFYDYVEAREKWQNENNVSQSPGSGNNKQVRLAQAKRTRAAGIHPERFKTGFMAPGHEGSKTNGLEDYVTLSHVNVPIYMIKDPVFKHFKCFDLETVKVLEKFTHSAKDKSPAYRKIGNVYRNGVKTKRVIWREVGKP